jgi:high-affinity nickel permease
VSYNWNGWDGEHKGTCVKTNSLVVAAAALNIVLDIWVIALPIPKVLTIQASINTKVQVVFMFSIGFLWVLLFLSIFELFDTYRDTSD